MDQWSFGTIAFGQRFEVTPIQMATMLSTIANGGTYIKPRVVKQIVDSQTKQITDIEERKSYIRTNFKERIKYDGNCCGRRYTERMLK